MGKVHGYIELDAKIVFDACQRYLEDREQREVNRKEEHIKKHMNKKFFPAKTREAAIKRTHTGYGFYSWQLKGRYWASLVEAIRDQASTGISVNKPVFISDDIHDCIGRFLTPAQKRESEEM